mmetsp:Transcript_33977/g.83515  ORF Transcript_33977/g.83515 Transcript_33977/m.83515 type:complete len:603 (-) Transcript_33977:1665-3473(-)
MTGLAFAVRIRVRVGVDARVGIILITAFSIVTHRSPRPGVALLHEQPDDVCVAACLPVPEAQLSNHNSLRVDFELGHIGAAAVHAGVVVGTSLRVRVAVVRVLIEAPLLVDRNVRHVRERVDALAKHALEGLLAKLGVVVEDNVGFHVRVAAEVAPLPVGAQQLVDHVHEGVEDLLQEELDREGDRVQRDGDDDEEDEVREEADAEVDVDGRGVVGLAADAVEQRDVLHQVRVDVEAVHLGMHVRLLVHHVEEEACQGDEAHKELHRGAVHEEGEHRSEHELLEEVQQVKVPELNLVRIDEAPDAADRKRLLRNALVPRDGRDSKLASGPQAASPHENEFNHVLGVVHVGQLEALDGGLSLHIIITARRSTVRTCLAESTASNHLAPRAARRPRTRSPAIASVIAPVIVAATVVVALAVAARLGEGHRITRRRARRLVRREGRRATGVGPLGVAGRLVIRGIRGLAFLAFLVTVLLVAVRVRDLHRIPAAVPLPLPFPLLRRHRATPAAHVNDALIVSGLAPPVLDERGELLHVEVMHVLEAREEEGGGGQVTNDDLKRFGVHLFSLGEAVLGHECLDRLGGDLVKAKLVESLDQLVHVERS